jgi:putative transposase
MTLFNNKYRIESARLNGWDYSSPGYYFVTICTHDRKQILSEIINGQVRLTPIGLIINEEWLRTGTIRENVALHEYVIMPNHLHGIIQIKPYGSTSDSVEIAVETSCHGVSTGNTWENAQPDKCHWKPGVLGAIVGQFKIQVSKRARSGGYHDFRWQPRFHDHIIRDSGELYRIRHYIIGNPKQWKKDRLNRQ